MVCLAIRKYAIDAGFLENYQVNVTSRRTGEGKNGQVEEVNFNLKDFKLRKEVMKISIINYFVSKRVHQVNMFVGYVDFQRYHTQKTNNYLKTARAYTTGCSLLKTI